MRPGRPSRAASPATRVVQFGVTVEEFKLIDAVRRVKGLASVAELARDYVLGEAADEAETLEIPIVQSETAAAAVS